MSSSRDVEGGPEQTHDLSAEGEQYGLATDVSRELSNRVCGEATDPHGRVDRRRARARFHELAARVARRGGQLRRDPGKGPAAADLDKDADVFGEEAPGKTTLVELEQQRLASQQQGTAPSVDPGLPHQHEVNAIRDGGRRSTPTSSSPSSESAAMRDELDKLVAAPSAVAVGASGGPARPPVRLPLTMLDRMERVFGRRFDDVELHVDSPEVSAGQSAFTRDRQIHVKPGFELDGPEGERVLAHELAHVVQQQGAGERAGTRDELESEAEEAAARVVQGEMPRIVLSAQASVAYGRPEGGKDEKAKDEKAKAAVSLPDGVNHRLKGTAGDQIVRTSWFMDGATVDGKKVRNPAKMRELNTELRQLFWWMSEAQVEASSRHIIDGAPLPEPVFIATLMTGTFQAFGLPPGTDIVWKSEADGEASVILSIRNAGIEQPPASDTSEFTIDDALRKRIDAKFTAAFGITPASTLLPRRTLDVKPDRWAWVLRYDKNTLAELVGPQWANAKAVKGDPTTDETSVFGGVTFPNYIPIADREYYVKWMEEALGKQAPSGGTGNVEIDELMIHMMKKLDQDTLLKEKVVERMRRAKGGPGFVLDSRSFRRLVHETEEEQERIRLGLQPTPVLAPEPAGPAKDKPYTSPHEVAVAPKSRFYERPITGKIVNLGSLASVGKTMDMFFDTEDPQGIGFVGVTIQWFASPVGEPTVHARKGTTFGYAHHKPEKWSVSFDQVGKYEITALVDHQSYWPTTFKSSVEVKTEGDRLKQVEDHAFGTLDDNITKREDSHFFEVSFTNDRFGSDKYTFGSVKEGELPKDFTSKTLDERLGFMKDDRKALEELIKTYEGRSDRKSKDVVDYAKAAIERLDESKQRVSDDGKDLTPFEVRGAFLSEKNGVRSGDLRLVGLAGSRHKSKQERFGKEDYITKEWDQPTVRLHDMSQLYEPKNAVYTGEGSDFRASAELAFIELCKSYPPGRVSLMMEQLTTGGAKTGKTLGFELHTGTAWKDAKEVVWDSKVQLIVNLAAAAAAIFLPGVGAAIAMGLVTAYNAVDTIDNLATLERKGQATTFDNAAAFVSIGLDIIPFAGELKAVGKLGKSTLFALDAAQVVTNVMVVTGEGISQVRALRDQQVKEVARLQQEVNELRSQGDSSLELKQKEAELAAAIKQAQDTAMEVFTEMGKNGAVMLMAPLAFNHMLRGFSKTGGGAELASSDLFVKGDKGETPHYKPETGKIHGDPELLTPELTAKLQEQWTLDVYAKHADAANVLGVTPREVVIKRDKQATKTAIKKNDDGIWEITAPESHPHQKILDEVWNARKAQPDAPKERPAALERGSYEPTMSVDDIIKVGKPVVVGSRIEGAGEADAVLKKLAAGDRKALKAVGIEKLPKGFDPRSVEWGLGRLPDGKYVIIRGDHGAVDWGPFPEVVPIAHTHPLRAEKQLKSDGGSVGIHILDMVKGGGANEHNKVQFFPSAADVAFCVRNGLNIHRVDTPYIHIGEGKVGNPVGDFADKPRISIEIHGAHHAGQFPGTEIPAHQAHVVVRDAKGTLIWEGDLVAVHHPTIGSLIQFGPVPSSWVKPGTSHGGIGGETGAGLRRPKNKAEQLAFDDWKKLEKSGKNYGGKFDGEDWYRRYEDGLRYDRDTDRWVRPDGRKARDPQEFDTRRWTKEKVYDYLAGPKSESTFKPFAEMLIAKKIATEAQIKKMIESKGFLGRNEDMVRHDLKVEYRQKILDHIAKEKTPELRHAEMLDVTRRLDSADKGNITEDWYNREILGGKGEAHVSARKDTLDDDQGIKISGDRVVDIVDGNIGREIKSTDAKLSDSDLAQMADYAKMVDGQAKLATDSGTKTIKHVRYTLTSPEGAKANVETMLAVFDNRDLAGRISFELFTPEGKRVIVKDEAQLRAQTWLTTK